MRILISLFLVLIAAMSSVSFAQEEPYGAQIKLLESAAAALNQFHSDVSKQLTQYAHDLSLWKDETKENKNEADDEKEEMLTQKKRKANIKLLRDSARFLQLSNLELSKELIILADRREKKMLELFPEH